MDISFAVEMPPALVVPVYAFIPNLDTASFEDLPNSMSVRTSSDGKKNLTFRPISAVSAGAPRVPGRIASIAVRAVKQFFMVYGVWSEL